MLVSVNTGELSKWLIFITYSQVSEGSKVDVCGNHI